MKDRLTFQPGRSSGCPYTSGMRPTFVVIGAKKAGTTSLHRYLSAHPEIWLPRDKRIEFFSTERWDRGPGWYEAQFAPSRGCTAWGEISTSYTRYPIVADVPARMRQVMPDVQLIYLLRDPIERLVSHYRHARVEGWVDTNIDEAVRSNPAEFVARSRYHLQISRYLEHFDPAQILLVTSEALRDDRMATMARIFGFLGVDPDHRPSTLDLNYNATTAMRAERPTLRRMRQSRAYRSVRELVPTAIRDAGWTLTTRPRPIDDADARLSPDTLALLLARLQPDLLALRDLMPPGFDAWGLLDKDS